MENSLHRAVSIGWVLQLMDADAMLAIHILRNPTSRFIEIGCGAAIPAIVLARLGRRDVSAFDASLEMVRLARKMVNLAGVKIELACRDFYYCPLCGGKDWIWIAAKPRGADGQKKLLDHIIARGILRKTGLALVPAYGPDPDPRAYRRVCDEVSGRLQSCGYGVTMRRLSTCFPLQGIIALPAESGIQLREKAARGCVPPGGLMRTVRSPSARNPGTATARRHR
ncbi:MAG: class I SAM-dependent methyltransferase [Candidatus Aminicenantes bacterium]|nr:class I SAM-dependent methyltransferase [Candidatus Aminicenantes bacterium]